MDLFGLVFKKMLGAKGDEIPKKTHERTLRNRKNECESNHDCTLLWI